jgi:hypothetical protein
MVAETSRRRGRDGAQVLVAVLLLGIPLSVLLVAVSQSGPAARQRLQMQTAADAAALAGGAWSARTCNLLAQIHQTEAQLAAGIALLRAVRPARARAEAVLNDLEASGTVPADAIAAERQLLREWEDGLADLFPLAEAGTPSGLWAAAETVESLRRALLQAIPAVAVQDAETFGRENGAVEVVVWPASPALPVTEGAPVLLRGRADTWVQRGVPRLTALFKAPLLSDARTLYRQETAAALLGLLGGSDFPARPVVWRGDAPVSLDVVAFAFGKEEAGMAGLTCAQARPVNPERGDLMTTGWAVRLVPAARIGRAFDELSLERRRQPAPPALRLTSETMEALTCH